MHMLRLARRAPHPTAHPSTPVPMAVLAVALVLLVILSGPFVEVASSQCVEEPPLQNWTGGGAVVCPCFISGEEGGSVLNAPIAHYPIQIIKVGVGWGSQLGGTGTQEEYAIHIYPAGLPNPGASIFNLLGPNLTDGFINEFDLEPEPGDIVLNSGPFTVTLELLNDSSLNGPSLVHDGNGCQSGKNVVYAIPGGWFNACALGVTGDWVFTATYRSLCPVSVGEEFTVSSGGAPPLVSLPNPFVDATRIEFRLAREAPVDLAVFDASGRRIAVLLSGPAAPGLNEVTWDGTDHFGRRVASGTYFLRLDAGGRTATRPLNLMR